VRLGSNKVVVESINVEFSPEIHEVEEIRMMSPMTILQYVERNGWGEENILLCTGGEGVCEIDER